MKIQLDISIEEIGQIAILIKASQALTPNELKPTSSIFMFYSEKDCCGYRRIKIGDKCKILPSENCVTNTDTIKYDEKIDGWEGVISGLDYRNNKVRVACEMKTINVQSTWIKYIGNDK